MGRYENFSFPSTGDADKDASEAARIRRREAWLDEGWCANGCGPRAASRFEGFSECPACGFVINRPAVESAWDGWYGPAGGEPPPDDQDLYCGRCDTYGHTAEIPHEGDVRD